ncbi:MAG: hypothetical protein AABY65_04585 [Nitrospirota bacterium]|mgnify:FL=1
MRGLDRSAALPRNLAPWASVLVALLAACAPRPVPPAALLPSIAEIEARQHPDPGWKGISVRLTIVPGSTVLFSGIQSAALLTADPAGFSRLQVQSPFGPLLGDLLVAEGRYSLYRPDLREVETGPVLGEDGRAVPMVILADLVQGQWFAKPIRVKDGWVARGAAGGRVTLARTDLGVISLFEEVTLDLASGRVLEKRARNGDKEFRVVYESYRTVRDRDVPWRIGVWDGRGLLVRLDVRAFDVLDVVEDRVRRLDLPPGTVIREKGPGLSM